MLSYLDRAYSTYSSLITDHTFADFFTMYASDQKSSSLPGALKKCRSIKDLWKKEPKFVSSNFSSSRLSPIQQNDALTNTGLPKLYDTLMVD